MKVSFILIVLLANLSGCKDLDKTSPKSIVIPKFTSLTLHIPSRRLHTGVAAGDLNNDGKVDLVFSAGRHRVDQSHIALNQGDRTFTYLPLGPYAGFSYVSLGKLNDDDYLDILLVGDSGSPGVTQSQAFVNPGNTDEEWQKIWETSESYSARKGVLSDLNGNGFSDILIATTNNTVDIYENKSGDIELSPTVSLPGLGERIVGLAVGDINNNGKKDIVAGSRNTSGGFATNTTYSNTGTSGATALEFNANPGFLFGAGLQTTGVAIGDMNNDGFNDIVSANGGSENKPGEDNYIYWGSGTGEFSVDDRSVYSAHSKSRIIHLVDLNKDNLLDMVLLNAGEANQIFINLGEKKFKAVDFDDDIEAVSRDVATGDFDGNGTIDIVVANYQSPSVIFYQD